MNLTVFTIILCIAVIAEAFCTIAVLLIIFRMKNEKGTEVHKEDEDLVLKSSPETKEMRQPDTTTLPKGAFVCWYNGNGMCANPQSKAFKKHCITTNPTLCRWSELRIQEDE